MPTLPTTSRIGVRVVPEGRLRLAASPTNELAAAALLAQDAAGIPPSDGADFVILAVPPGAAGDRLARHVQAAAEAWVAEHRPDGA